MADAVDYGSIEQQLRARAQAKGLQYDPSDLEDIQRNASYTDAAGNPTGTDAATGLQNAFKKYDERAASGQSGPTVQYQTPTQAWNSQPSSPSGGYSSALYALLMQRASQNPVATSSDPTVRAQVDPVVAQQTRASRGYLNDLAEKAGPLANLQGEQRLAAERSGQAAGALESEVIGRVNAQRSQEIQQALSLYGNQLSSDQRLALEKELAYLSDSRQAAGQQLQQQSLNQSNDQFLRELALREANQNNTWDFQWAALGA